MSNRCDIVLTSRHEVYINGNLIGNVYSLNVEQDPNRPTMVTLELAPTSLMFGEIPKEQVEQIRQSPDEEVDIERAMRNAMSRSHGIDPMANVKAVVASTPAPKTKPARKAYRNDEAMAAEAEPGDY